jgi:hypothetical protein
MSAGSSVVLGAADQVTGPLGDGHVEALELLAGAMPTVGQSRNLACIQAVAATAHCGARHRGLRT